MDFSESRTYANLMTAFAGESQARNKYTFYAKQAEDGGYRQISDIYKETAENERAHAEIWFRLLHGDGMPSVYDGLLDAADVRGGTDRREADTRQSSLQGVSFQ